ncbi:hypothetical protein Clacol_005117 [Clathrus columnatus]|uniref:Uncharacterized protein n=1 Tax=Clathrus columnatus TaxID=1419009 RepID=A0AAV5A8E2_9AGAM|nr:hypothetical protein Clacol_005117 [Clathrus columnatus]
MSESEKEKSIESVQLVDTGNLLNTIDWSVHSSEMPSNPGLHNPYLAMGTEQLTAKHKLEVTRADKELFETSLSNIEEHLQIIVIDFEERHRKIQSEIQGL